MVTHASGPEHPRSTPMTTPSDPPAPLTPAQQDAAFRPSHTPATPWPASCVTSNPTTTWC